LTGLISAPPGAEGWHGPYVKRRANLIDPWGHSFNYRSPGQHGEFDIFSYGTKDGEDATGNPAIANW
jgi:general secretion pathway protein G